MYLVSVNSFQKLVRLILKINPNQAFCRENVTVTSEKCMVDPWIIRYPCMEVKNLLFFLCVYSFWQLTLRCIQNCFDCCYRWLGSGSTRRKGETSFIVNTAVLSYGLQKNHVPGTRLNNSLMCKYCQVPVPVFAKLVGEIAQP